MCRNAKALPDKIVPAAAGTIAQKSDELTFSSPLGGRWGAMLRHDDGWWYFWKLEPKRSRIPKNHSILVLKVLRLRNCFHKLLPSGLLPGQNKGSQVVAQQPTARCRCCSRWSRNHVSHKADDSAWTGHSNVFKTIALLVFSSVWEVGPALSISKACWTIIRSKWPIWFYRTIDYRIMPVVALFFSSWLNEG